MSLYENNNFLGLRDKAAKLLGENQEIGKCCTVDCIIGLIKAHYDDLAADEIEEIIEIMQQLNNIEEIRDLELKEFFDKIVDYILVKQADSFNGRWGF